MRNRAVVRAALGLLGAVCVVAPAVAQGTKAAGGRTTGYYISGEYGAAAFTRSANSGLGVSNTQEYSTGRALALAVGYAWSRGKRADVEIASRSADVANIERPGQPLAAATGSVRNLALLANFHWGAERWSWITPFVSIGGGFARTTFADVVATGVALTSEGAWTLAYQFGVGAEFPLTARLALNTSFRVFSVDQPRLENIQGRAFKTTFTTRDLLVGLRYQF